MLISQTGPYAGNYQLFHTLIKPVQIGPTGRLNLLSGRWEEADLTHLAIDNQFREYQNPGVECQIGGSR